MTSLSLTPTQIMVGLGVLLVLLMVWRGGARRARATAEAARAGAGVASLAGRVLFNAAFIVGVQWVLIVYRADGWLLLAALGLPALLASYSLTRALTVTTRDVPRRRSGGHR